MLMLALVALVALPAGTASAHKKNFPTSVTATKQIIPGTDNARANYSGTVTSPNPKCVGGRTITVGNNDGLLGSTRTDAAGNWSIPNISSTAVGAGPTQKVLVKNKKHKHVCKFAVFEF